MADNFFDSLKNSSPDKVNRASQLIREALGNDFDINAMLGNDRLKQNLNLKLSESDKQKIAALVNNPEVLRAMLSSPQMRDGLKNFFGKK